MQVLLFLCTCTCHNISHMCIPVISVYLPFVSPGVLVSIIILFFWLHFNDKWSFTLTGDFPIPLIDLPWTKSVKRTSYTVIWAVFKNCLAVGLKCGICLILLKLSNWESEILLLIILFWINSLLSFNSMNNWCSLIPCSESIGFQSALLHFHLIVCSWYFYYCIDKPKSSFIRKIKKKRPPKM